jgi:O-antigen/teichoic acid export membrane protein
MRFVEIMFSDLSGSAVRAGVSIVLALAGYGVASLAWGSLAGTAAMTIAVLILRPERGIYSINFEHMKHVFRFGSTVFGSNVIRTIATDSSPIIIGRMLGLASAGFYSRAEGLVNMVGTYLVQGIKEVALPAFAQEHRTGSNLASLYLQRQQMLTGIAWPVLTFLAIEANPLILVFYGQQWQDSVAPARYICLANAFSMVLPIADATLFAMGRVGTILKLVTLRTVMVVAAFVIGGFYDLDRLAAFQIIPAMVGAVLYSIAVARASALDQGRMFRTFLPSLLVSAGVATVLLASNTFLGSLQIGPFPALSLCAAIGTAFYMLLLWLSRHPLWDELLRLRDIRSWLT